MTKKNKNQIGNITQLVKCKLEYKKMWQGIYFSYKFYYITFTTNVLSDLKN